MMTGLMGDTDEGARKTAEELAALCPACVRIYPTIVLRGTELGEAYLHGEYQPADAWKALFRFALDLLDFFEVRGIDVIRLGLHASPELERDMLAGPWHPAFRELCESRRFLEKITEALQISRIPKGPVAVAVNPACVSQATGQKKGNLRELAGLGYAARIVPDASVERGGFKII